MRLFGNSIPLPVLVVCGALAASLLGDSMLYAVMPSRPDDWGLSIGLVGILLSANRLVRLVSNTLAAHVFTRLGPRIPIGAAMVLAVATTATYGWATAFWLLLLARMTWGLSWSMLRLGAWWTVLEEATDANRGFLMGVYSAVARSGSMVGVVAGGILTDAIGHRWTLTIFAILTALGGLTWLATSGGGKSPTKPAPEGSTTGTFALVLRDRRLLMTGLGGLAGMLVFSGLLTASLGFYLDARFGDRIGLAGLTIGVASFTGIALGIRFGIDLVLAPSAGSLSDRLGRTPVVLAAFVLGAAGLLTLAAAPPLGIVIVAVIAAFVSSTALIVLLHARAGDLAPPSRRAAVMSVYATFLDLGSALGPLVGLSLGTLGGLRWAFVGGGLLLLLMALLYRRVTTDDLVVRAVEVSTPFSR